ncbi:MAG: hypothetical protein ACR2LX_15955 [Jatrophihabitans sp.]
MVSHAKHAHPGDPRKRHARLYTLAVVWLAGVAAGFFAILASFAAYGCSSSDNGLACRTSGTVVAVLVVVAVIAVVTAATVFTYERDPRRVVTVGVCGVVALVVCFLAARGLLSTV